MGYGPNLSPIYYRYWLLQEVDTSTGKHGFGMFGGAVLITTWITVLVVTIVMRRASKDPSPLLQVHRMSYSIW